MSQERIAGFDIARSLAIFGMVIVHFLLVMTDGVPSERCSDTLLQLLDGRPAATFVILAGMGVTLMSNKLTDPNAVHSRKETGAILRRRGLLLLGFGFLNLTICQGDILRIHGVSLLIVPWLVWRSSRTLLLTSLAFTWYAAHIVIGLGGVIILGWTRTSHLRALGAGVGFFAAAVTMSLWWLGRFRNGPLESVLRSVG